MIIESTYRDSGHQFQMQVVGEDKDNYLVQLLPKWQDSFQEKDKIHTLRKCLIGAIYRVLEETTEQVSIFDLIGE